MGFIKLSPSIYPTLRLALPQFFLANASIFAPKGLEHSSPGQSGAATAAKRRPGLTNRSTQALKGRNNHKSIPHAAFIEFDSVSHERRNLFRPFRANRHSGFVIPGRRSALRSHPKRRGVAWGPRPWADMSLPFQGDSKTEGGQSTPHCLTAFWIIGKLPIIVNQLTSK